MGRWWASRSVCRVPAIGGVSSTLETSSLSAAIYIDPHAAQVTDTSDPFPTIIAGIPSYIGHVNVNINRPGLHVQPDELQTDGDHGDNHGRRRRVLVRSRVPFQVTGRTGLLFKPKQQP